MECLFWASNILQSTITYLQETWDLIVRKSSKAMIPSTGFEGPYSRHQDGNYMQCRYTWNSRQLDWRQPTNTANASDTANARSDDFTFRDLCSFYHSRHFANNDFLHLTADRGSGTSPQLLKWFQNISIALASLSTTTRQRRVLYNNISLPPSEERRKLAPLLLSIRNLGDLDVHEWTYLDSVKDQRPGPDNFTRTYRIFIHQSN